MLSLTMSPTRVSDMPLKTGESCEQDQFDSCGATRPKERKKVFPEVLHDLLTFASEDSNVANIVMWLPSGMAFVIFEPQKFEQVVLPKFFPQSRYASFTRKLNRWGFRQISKGPDRGAFHHDLFRRDNPQMCLQMTCVKARKSPALDDHSRNFYTQALAGAGALGSPSGADRFRIGGVPQGMGCFPGAGGSNNLGNFSNITTESLEEMLRNQQKALEVQRAKLNAQRALLENHANTLRSASAGNDNMVGRLGDEESAMLRAAGSSRNILQQMGQLTDMHQLTHDVDQFPDLQTSSNNNMLFASQEQMRNMHQAEFAGNDMQEKLLMRANNMPSGPHHNAMQPAHSENIDFDSNFPQHMHIPSTGHFSADKDKMNMPQDFNYDRTALLRYQYQQQMALNALQSKTNMNSDSLLVNDVFGGPGFQEQNSADPLKPGHPQMLNSPFSPEELYHLAAMQQHPGMSNFGSAHNGKPRNMKLEGGRAA